MQARAMQEATHKPIAVGDSVRISRTIASQIEEPVRCRGAYYAVRKPLTIQEAIEAWKMVVGAMKRDIP